jgi:nitrite reductase/ring-hydroxylating ferredoxin subunit
LGKPGEQIVCHEFVFVLLLIGKMKLKVTLFLLSSLLIFSFPSCKKDQQTVEIPYFPVNFSIVLANPQFNRLNAPGGYVYVTGGSKGIIIYRAGAEQFIALDRHCPYRVDENCRVMVNATQVVAADSCCGSEFVLTDGSVIKGPSTFSLQRYQTEFDGSVLRVYN